MSVPIDRAIIRTGSVRSSSFFRDCVSGHWVDFRVSFPERFVGDLPKIIITPNDLNVQGNYNPAVVGMVRDVTHSEFYISAKNSDLAEGFAGFNWMAVHEASGRRSSIHIGMTGGTLEPKHFQPDGVHGDWQSWPVSFGSPLDETPVVLLCPCDHHVSQSLAAAVGTARTPGPEGFTLAARSSDCSFGSCNFSYLALSDRGKNAFSKIDSGWVTMKRFEKDCAPGDWQHWLVKFHEHFENSPLVFLTAHGGSSSVELDHFPRITAVGIAQRVTEEGFLLAARNPECWEGYCGFYWVAVG